MSAVVDLDEDTWRERVGASRACVIEFWAPWCSSCLVQRPIIDDLARSLAAHLDFFRVDVAATRIDRALGVRALPTVLVMRDGREVARRSGDVTRADLLEAFAAALS
ncbi:thioredoxin family protein [Nanchangia anserum]|uniref:Thioredoxin family protein n=1 Tax=Nanchangia anserum TaxID=2692125 RepID=A0A8I0KW68_9ACTO|nr:thioredoxin family protein [Nanchangia anserum]MBD3689694.1 thioredoxin family protein [Nanchangia anserum]QOX81870.1 thioredoxin family protein [Nanchangia anserum]